MKKTLLFFLCTSLCLLGRAQSTIGNQNVDQFKIDATGDLEYGLTWLPASYSSNPSKKYALIIFLHGSGEAGTTLTDLNRMTTWGVPNKIANGFQPSAVNPLDGQTYEFIVCSPMNSSWSPDWSTLRFILPDIVSRYRVDTTRIYLTGFSAGGGTAFGAIASNDSSFITKIAAIATSSEAGVTAINGMTETQVEKQLRFATTKYGVHAWTMVGDQDALLDNNAHYIDSTNILNPAIHNKLTIVSGLGHTTMPVLAFDSAFRPTLNTYASNISCNNGCSSATAPNNNGSPVRGSGVTQDSLNMYEWLLLYHRQSGSTAPTAITGGNQTITLPVNSVTLDGSASTGTITSYAWTKISGGTATITSPSSVTTTVTGLAQGIYVFQLSLNGGASMASDTITVNPASTDVGNQKIDKFPVDASGDSLFGLTWLPASYSTSPAKKYPLIIFLHGSGQAGTGQAGLSNLINAGLPQKIAAGLQPSAVSPIDSQTYEFIVVSPQDPSWTPTYSKLKYILPDVLSRYRVDSSSVYLTGDIQGGDGLFSTLGSTDSNFIRRFAAAATANSIGVDGVNGLTDVQVEAHLRDATKAYGVQVWTVAGELDGHLGIDVAYHDSVNKPGPVVPDKLTVIGGATDTTWKQLYDPNWRPKLNYYGSTANCDNGCAVITAPAGNISGVPGSGVTQDSLNLYEWLLLYHRAGGSGGSGGAPAGCHGTRHILTPDPVDSSVYFTHGTTPSTTTIAPGDTLVLNSAYSSVDLQGLQGTASCPIVIVNQDVQTLLTKRLTLDGCQYVKVTGSGTSAPYGIFIQQDPVLRQQSYHGIEIKNRSRSIEVERVSMHNVDIGIVCESNEDCDTSLDYPNWVLDSMSFHDNRIVGTWNEGMYIGNTSPDNASYDLRPVVCNGVTYYYAPMKNGYARIYNNYVDSTGRGGIQLANAAYGVSEIYGNTVKHNGLNGDGAQGTGISLGLYTRAYVHDNTVVNTYTWGIVSLGAGSTDTAIRIEHNTIDSSGYLKYYAGMDTTSRVAYNPGTEPSTADALTWPQSIEIDTRPRLYTTDSPHPGTAVPGKDSTQFVIRDNIIGLKKNTVAINIDDDYAGIQKSGNYICSNVNAVGGTAATVQVASGVNYSTDCSGLTAAAKPPQTRNGAQLTDSLTGHRVRVYPNPTAQQSVTVEVENEYRGRMRIMVVDLSGKVMLTKEYDKQGSLFRQPLELPASLRGIYLLRVYIPGDVPAVFKLIKE
jgi:predicted peptidase